MAAAKKQKEVFLGKCVQLQPGEDPVYGLQKLDPDLADELVEAGLAKEIGEKTEEKE